MARRNAHRRGAAAALPDRSAARGGNRPFTMPREWRGRGPAKWTGRPRRAGHAAAAL